MTNWNNLAAEAQKWIREAGHIIKQSFQKELIIDTKANKADFVTNIDQKVERFFIENIKSTYPTHKILGEEGYGDRLKDLSGIVWIIDPIDGTMNFIHQRRNFAITIGIYKDGVGMLGFIYDVVHDEMYVGQLGNGVTLNGVQLPKLASKRVDEAIIGINASWVSKNEQIDPLILGRLVNDSLGTRSYGSAAIEMSYIATSRVDAYISLRLAPWDFAGGKIIVEELGGVATQICGSQLNMLESCPLLIAKPGLHEEILTSYIKPYL